MRGESWSRGALCIGVLWFDLLAILVPGDSSSWESGCEGRDNNTPCLGTTF